MLVRQLRRKHHRAQSSCPLSEVCELSTEMGDWSSYQSTTEPRRTVHDAVLRGSQIVAKGSFVKMDLCLWLCQPGLCGTEFGV